MRRRRVLLILDNAETMSQEVLNFARHVPPPSKVLLTSWAPLDNFPTIGLMALDAEEAFRLALREAQARGLSLDREKARQLAEASGGLPLAIQFAVGRLAGGETLETVLDDLRNPRGDLATYLVDRQVQEIRNDPAAWRLFLAAGLLDPERGFSRESEEERDEALIRLVGLSLLDQRGEDRLRKATSLADTFRPSTAGQSHPTAPLSAVEGG